MAPAYDARRRRVAPDVARPPTGRLGRRSSGTGDETVASPLLEIPGARRRRTPSRGSDRFRARPVVSVNLTRPPLSLERRRRRTPRQWYREWSRRPISRLVRWLVVVALVAGLVAAWRTTFAGL